MVDLLARRDELARRLDERGWEVVDTFRALEGHPAVVVATDQISLDGEALSRGEVVLLVRGTGVAVDHVEFTDAGVALTAEQRELLDEVADEKFAGADVTVWECEPDACEDVDSIENSARELYEDVTG